MNTFLFVFLLLASQFKPSGEIDELVFRLRKGDESARVSAAQKLMDLGNDLPPKAILALLEATTDSSETVCVAASKTLKSSGSTTIPVLIDTIAAQNANSWQARVALSAFGKTSIKPITNELARGVPRSWHWELYEVLGELGPDAMEAIPELEKGLKSNDAFARLHAAGAIAKINPTNKSIRDALNEGLKRPEKEWRLYAAEHLARTRFLKTKESLAVLVDFIQDEKTEINHLLRAVVSIAQYGQDARDNIEVLKKKMAKAKDIPEWRVIFAGAIVRIDPQNREARDILQLRRTELEAIANRPHRSFLTQFAKDLLRDADSKVGN